MGRHPSFDLCPSLGRDPFCHLCHRRLCLRPCSFPSHMSLCHHPAPPPPKKKEVNNFNLMGGGGRNRGQLDEPHSLESFGLGCCHHEMRRNVAFAGHPSGGHYYLVRSSLNIRKVPQRSPLNDFGPCPRLCPCPCPHFNSKNKLKTTLRRTF